MCTTVRLFYVVSCDKRKEAHVLKCPVVLSLSNMTAVKFSM